MFTSDNWDPFEVALVEIFGTLERPPYKGRGRPHDPVWVPHGNLKYAQVCKRRKNGRVVDVVQRVVFGDEEEVLEILGADDDRCINTAYVERFNLTTRTCLARFVRKGMNFSKDLTIHSRVMDLYQAWYNLVKPHRSLSVRCDNGKRKWTNRTPMMAEGRTDHVWTLKELLSFRIPVHR